MAAPPAPPAPIPDAGACITRPLQVFHAGRGELGPEDVSAAWIAANIRAPDVDYVVVREAGHWPWPEQPEWFLSHLEPFLARTGRP